MKKGFDSFQDPQFYAKRYIISQAMSWNEVAFLKDGTKANKWKNAIQTKIRISPENSKNIEIQGDQIYRGITEIKEETANDDTKTKYLALHFQKDCIAVACRQDILDLLYTAICSVLDLPVEKSIFSEKTEQMKNMINDTKHFLDDNVEQESPPIPPAPNMALVEKLYPSNPY